MNKLFEVRQNVGTVEHPTIADTLLTAEGIRAVYPCADDLKSETWVEYVNGDKELVQQSFSIVKQSIQKALNG